MAIAEHGYCFHLTIVCMYEFLCLFGVIVLLDNFPVTNAQLTSRDDHIFWQFPGTLLNELCL